MIGSASVSTKIRAGDRSQRRREALGGMEEFADGFAQRIEGDWFAQNDVDCGRFRSADFNQGAEASEHDYRDSVIDLLDETGGLIAAHLRHDAVEDYEIEPVPAKFLQAFAAACGGGNGMPVTTKVCGNDFKNPGLVVNDQNIERGFR